jgi:RHS repeat-associated protein
MTTPPTATQPDGITTGYGYDAGGDLTTVTAPDSGSSMLTTTYGYDRANRLTSATYSDDTTPNVTYGYDADGRRTSMSDGTGTTSYNYNLAGWLTSTTNGEGATVGYDYDEAGDPITITYPGNHRVTRGYDDSGRLTSLVDWNSNESTFNYDADSDLTKIQYPNGVSETNSYSDADVLTQLADTTASSTLADYTYSRDAADNLTAVTSAGTDAGPDETYGENDLNQLGSYSSGSVTSTLGYDNDGNATTLPDGTTLSYDTADELVTSTGPSVTTAYSDNERGDRTESNPTVGATQNYSYDQADRLTGYSAGSTVAQYAYDGDGLRAAKTVGSTTSAYVWDQVSGDAPLLLSDGIDSYLYGPNDVPIEQVAADGTTTFLQHDQQGSTRLLTDASGGVIGTYAYDPYGKTIAHTGASVALRFDGQYQDDESGLYYLRARHYDPTTAQFITRDPLDDETGQPYSYAGDDPLDNSDPSGLSFWGDVSDWTAGFGDTITFGGTEQIRRLINYQVNGDMNDVVDLCSTFYSWGGYGALDASAGLGVEDAADLLSSGWERLRSLDWADDTGAIGAGNRLTTAQATQMAERVGYRPTSYFSKGERVFTNGNNFITQDTTAHSGGLWKMASSPQGFGPGDRLGTYDYNLDRIGP